MNKILTKEQEGTVGTMIIVKIGITQRIVMIFQSKYF